MESIAPDMVLDKHAIDTAGAHLGRIIDVGLYDHSRVKYLLVEDDEKSVPVRLVGIENVEGVNADSVRLRIRTG